MKTAILWFRRDLRLQDNPAVQWVAQNASHVLPVYIHSPEEEGEWAPGSASRWWLHQSLEALGEDLQKLGYKLHHFRGDSLTILRQLQQHAGADTVVMNRLYEPALMQRDAEIIEQLDDVDIIVEQESVLFEPGAVMNNQGAPYRVYTPFYRKTVKMLDEITVLPDHDLRREHVAALDIQDDGLHGLGLLDTYAWYDKLSSYWKPGEAGAKKLLGDFSSDGAVARYDVERDIPSSDGTSRLSPHLHFGEIGPRQVIGRLREAGEAMDTAGAEVFIKQILWREFAKHILWHYPHTSNRSMDERYSENFWKQGTEQELAAWRRGETGIPIVDAGMKELWETGWMHNRVRMIVASFLTKNLGVHWLEGARWFWDTLVDADLANNSLGWQWVAGCGVDAAPYFRVFNPNTQMKRFDPDQEYIDRWLPEVRELGYPTPMVDLSESRSDALLRYENKIKNTGATS